MKIIYDIGANIGVTCIPAVNRGLVKNAFAVEPETSNFELLKLNVSHLTFIKTKIFSHHKCCRRTWETFHFCHNWHTRETPQMKTQPETGANCPRVEGCARLGEMSLS